MTIGSIPEATAAPEPATPAVQNPYLRIFTTSVENLTQFSVACVRVTDGSLFFLIKF